MNRFGSRTVAQKLSFCYFKPMSENPVFRIEEPAAIRIARAISDSRLVRAGERFFVAAAGPEGNERVSLTVFSWGGAGLKHPGVNVQLQGVARTADAPQLHVQVSQAGVVDIQNDGGRKVEVDFPDAERDSVRLRKSSTHRRGQSPSVNFTGHRKCHITLHAREGLQIQQRLFGFRARWQVGDQKVAVVFSPRFDMVEGTFGCDVALRIK